MTARKQLPAERPDIVARAKWPLARRLECWANSFDVERIFTAGTNAELCRDLRSAVKVLRSRALDDDRPLTLRSKPDTKRRKK